MNIDCASIEISFVDKLNGEVKIEIDKQKEHGYSDLNFKNSTFIKGSEILCFSQKSGHVETIEAFILWKDGAFVL